MLGKIRDQAGSWFFKTFLTLIALSFILWGVGEIATGSFNSTAITVNDTKIPAQAVSRAYQAALRNMENRVGSELTDVHKQQIRLGERTVMSIITETLLTDYASNLDIRIANEHLDNVLRNMKNFQNSEGKFDQNVYRNALREQHDMTVEGFEKLITGQLSRLALNSIFDTPAIDDKKALERISQTNREEITINALTITPKSIGAIKNPTTEEQQAYYDKSLDRWQTPETRSFNVLKISAEKLAENIIISDTDAANEYEANMDSYNVPEKRQAQHVLVKTEEEAKKLLIKINKGADFATIAKKHSIDKFSAKSGGDLGKFAATDMVESFSNAAFALKKGKISDIIESPFGYHIIKLTNSFPAYLQTFEQVKETIKASLASEKAEEVYAEMIEEIEDAIAGGDNLKQISTDLKLPFTLYTDKTRWDGMIDSNMLAPEESAATRSAFALLAEDISDKIDLTNTSSIYVGVTKIVAPVQESFELVKASVLKDMLHEARLRKIADKANEIFTMNKNGKTLKEIAKSESTSTYTTVEKINKQLQNAPSWFSWPQASQLFDFPAEKYLSAPIYHNEKYTVVELNKRTTPEITDIMLQEDKARLTAAIGNDLRLQYVNHLYKNAKISFNIPLLKRAMPGEPVEEKNIAK